MAERDFEGGDVRFFVAEGQRWMLEIEPPGVAGTIRLLADMITEDGVEPRLTGISQRVRIDHAKEGPAKGIPYLSTVLDQALDLKELAAPWVAAWKVR